MKTNKTPSILNNNCSVEAAKHNEEEGVDYINVSKNSITDLGKQLSQGFPFEVKTVFGVAGSIRSALEYVSVPGYPQDILKLKYLNPKQIKSIPKNAKIKVPNFGAIMAYVLCMRIKDDKQLKSMLRKNKLRFTAIETQPPKELFGVMVEVSSVNQKLGRYLSAIRYIEQLIKENRFNMETITEFVEACKDHPEQDLFEGTAAPIKTTRKEVAMPREDTAANFDEVTENQSGVLSESGEIIHYTLSNGDEEIPADEVTVEADPVSDTDPISGDDVTE